MKNDRTSMCLCLAPSKSKSLRIQIWRIAYYGSYFFLLITSVSIRKNIKYLVQLFHDSFLVNHFSVDKETKVSLFSLSNLAIIEKLHYCTIIRAFASVFIVSNLFVLFKCYLSILYSLLV